MATKEEISMTGFAIVAYAGDAKTDLIEALNEARKGNFEHARSLVKEARQSIDDAHNEQTKLLSKEAGDVTFIMVHGQDTLMTTMMLLDTISFTIDEYERLAAIEKQLGIALPTNDIH